QGSGPYRRLIGARRGHRTLRSLPSHRGWARSRPIHQKGCQRGAGAALDRRCARGKDGGAGHGDRRVSDPRPSLRGKAILITGAATGIGRATAELLAGLGANVFGIGLDANAGEELAASGVRANLRLTFRVADVTVE